MSLPETREEARQTGSEFYFTGKPCKHGHLAPRITKRGQCVECRKVEWQVENERRKTLPKSEAAKAAGRRYYENNRELVVARAQLRPTEDKQAYRRKWKAKNPERNQANNNAWRRRQKNATPKWLTKEQRKTINQTYLYAKHMTELTGIKYVVDHVIPLRGENVCGLHVPENLKLLTHEANCKKSNKH
jgi:hypothetical protein